MALNLTQKLEENIYIINLKISVKHSINHFNGIKTLTLNNGEFIKLLTLNGRDLQSIQRTAIRDQSTLFTNPPDQPFNPSHLEC